MQDTQIDIEQLQKQKKLWKIFGYDNKVGRDLYALYNKIQKPKINYPKTRPKTQKQINKEKSKLLLQKKCPQKTIISYPETIMEPQIKYHAIDFVPKRKNQNVIRKQIQEYYRNRAKDIPANRGVDREKLVKKLQEKFKMQRGGLPKGAELPSMNQQIKFNEQLIKQQAKLKEGIKSQKYTSQLKMKNQIDNKKKKETKQQINKELQNLFDKIVQQISQRQKYLQSIKHLDEPKLKQQIKNQMIQRISQLEKLTSWKK